VVRYFWPNRCDTNAYTSVVFAASSSVISGASMWLDADAACGAASRIPAAAATRSPERNAFGKAFR
jgi:hypothetical protein